MGYILAGGFLVVVGVVLGASLVTTTQKKGSD